MNGNLDRTGHINGLTGVIYVTVVVKPVHALVWSTEVAASRITETQVGQSASVQHRTQTHVSLSVPHVNAGLAVQTREEAADPLPAADTLHFASPS